MSITLVSPNSPALQNELKLRIPELLMPAGDPEKMRYAIAYGADAVYLGLSFASLRTVNSKDPFTTENIAEHVAYCQSRGVKAYVTLNIFASNRDIQRLVPHVELLEQIKPDAIILSDPGIFRLVQKHAPSVPIHVSTQANTLNASACAFWQDLGAERVILAREVPLREIAEIHEMLPDLELECFMHGSLCVAYSGRCVISDYLTDNTKNSNKGMCGNSCRWEFDVKGNAENQHSCSDAPQEEKQTETKEFKLQEVTRPDTEYTLEEDEKGSYLFNSKDLCLVRFLPEITKAGIVSIKAEGRTKGVHYVATVARVYREALDYLAANGLDNPAPNQQIIAWEDELRDTANRGFTTGFLHGKPSSEAYHYQSSQSDSNATFVANCTGNIKASGAIELIARNQFSAEETLTCMTPKGLFTLKPKSIENANGLQQSIVNPNQAVWIALDDAHPVLSLSPETLQWGLVRRRES